VLQFDDGLFGTGKTRLIDIHSHILPGLDDGARTMDDSVELARHAVRDGITAIVATPHVRHDYPTPPERMESAVDRVRAALDSEGVPLELWTGGEGALEQLMAMDARTMARFSLGGAGRYVLVEFPYDGWPLPLPSEIERLSGSGVTAVIAHPERNADVQARPERIGPLVEAGALIQLTAASVDRRLGRRAATAARRLLDLGLAHVIASDAHMPGVRAVGMAAAAEAVGDPAVARWMTHDVPAAIVAGEGIPSRPSTPRRRRGLWR
jgi:protein-tyrosine phosphatase